MAQARGCPLCSESICKCVGPSSVSVPLRVPHFSGRRLVKPVARRVSSSGLPASSGPYHHHYQNPAMGHLIRPYSHRRTRSDSRLLVSRVLQLECDHCDPAPEPLHIKRLRLDEATFSPVPEHPPAPAASAAAAAAAAPEPSLLLFVKDSPNPTSSHPVRPSVFDLSALKVTITSPVAPDSGAVCSPAARERITHADAALLELNLSPSLPRAARNSSGTSCALESMQQRTAAKEAAAAVLTIASSLPTAPVDAGVFTDVVRASVQPLAPFPLAVDRSLPPAPFSLSSTASADSTTTTTTTTDMDIY